MEKIEQVKIDIETFNGVFLILCGVSWIHSHAEVYPQAIPIMEKAHRDFIELGKAIGLDSRGANIKQST